MSGTSDKLTQASFWDSPNGISSPALPEFHLDSGSPQCPMTSLCLPADSHALMCLLPDKAQASEPQTPQPTAAASGGKCSELSEAFDPDTWLSKMFPRCGLAERMRLLRALKGRATVFSVQLISGRSWTLSLKRTSLGRSWWVLGRSARRIEETECGLWPTATVNGNHNRKGASENSGDGLSTAVKEDYWSTPQAHERDHAPKIFRRGNYNLAAQLMWPIPMVPNGGRQPKGGAMSPTGQTPDGKKRQVDLNFAVREWPTPTASVPQDGESLATWLARRESLKTTANNGNGCSTPLTMAIQMEQAEWPTPRSSPNENRTTRNAPTHGNGHGKTLAGEVNEMESAWPTPSARDWKDSGQEPAAQMRNSPCLPASVALDGQPAPASRNPIGSMRGQACLRLYSLFGVECGRAIRRRYERRSKSGKRKRISVSLSARWTLTLMNYPASWLD